MKQITYAQGLAIAELINEYSAYSVPGVTFVPVGYLNTSTVDFHVLVGGELRSTWAIGSTGIMQKTYSDLSGGTFTNAEFGYSLFPKFAN